MAFSLAAIWQSWSMNDVEYIAILYRQLLGREPDEAGMRQHLDLLKQHGDDRKILAALLASPEFASHHSARPDPIDLTGLLQRPITIVDVGAQNLAAEPPLYAALLESGLPCHCIGFEPLDHRRIERAQSDSSITVLPDFIGDGSEQTFYVNNDDATSSLLPLNRRFNQAFNHLKDLETVRTSRVKTSKLDEVLNSVPTVDLLKLDIQGFELNALHGARNCLKRTNVVHCEVEFARIYEAQPLFSEVELLLRHAGFEFIDFHELCRYAYVSVPKPSQLPERLCWGDAIFFRNLRETGGTWSDALGQVAIATHVYGKNGLAQQILLEAEIQHTLRGPQILSV
jgi:FkbM family methyltransferase